ncbi:MAG: NADPH-dependent oxidoreductase [Rhodospirillaceae bacterium]|nr:NADPH-dependent oxidoreductase [Rhodospirillaceae bacterium]
MDKKTTIADLIEDRYGVSSGAGADMAADSELANILGHRTHRRFTDEPVSNDLLEVLLAAAFSAPAKSDLQQSAVVIVRNADKRKEIANLIPSMEWIGTCPVFMVFLGDSRRIRRICEMRGKPFANDHLDAFMNAAVDTGLVLMNFIRAAESVGLGCCPISVVRNHIDAISEILDLPDHVFPVAGMTLGHPATEGYISLRLHPAVNVHIDRYDDSGLATEIDAYDRRRDARFSIPQDKQRMSDSFGVANFYGWSEDKARQVAVRERDQLAGYLKSKGFNLNRPLQDRSPGIKDPKSFISWSPEPSHPMDQNI